MDYANSSTIPGYPGVANIQKSLPSPESESRVRNEVCSIEQLLSSTHEMISEIERRFETVLVPSAPATAGQSSGKNQSNGSHLCGRLAILREGFEAAIVRMQDITRRAEL